MTRFSLEEKKRPAFTSILPFMILLLTLLLFIFGINHLASAQTSEQRSLLEQSVNRSITQCYALEGIYPPGLSYLTEHYGLTYDTDKYFIDYQYIASNLRPDITVIERN